MLEQQLVSAASGCLGVWGLTDTKHSHADGGIVIHDCKMELVVWLKKDTDFICEEEEKNMIYFFEHLFLFMIVSFILSVYAQ